MYGDIEAIARQVVKDIGYSKIANVIPEVFDLTPKGLI